MECQYYNPKIQILLCRRRTTEWNSIVSFKEPFWRFYWHCSTPAKIYFNDDYHELGPDTFSLISPETDFSSAGNEEFEQFYIHFQAGHPYDCCVPGVYTFKLNNTLREQIERISSLLITEERAPSRQLSLLILSVCNEALSFIPENTLNNDYTSRRIKDSLEYIDLHFSEYLTNDHLAKRAGMNTNAFIRFFKQHTGSAPQQAIQDRRIREACLLLRYSTRTIDEIAQLAGFSDRYYFSRVFKKKRGVGPAQFRKHADFFGG